MWKKTSKSLFVNFFLFIVPLSALTFISTRGGGRGRGERRGSYYWSCWNWRASVISTLCVCYVILVQNFALFLFICCYLFCWKCHPLMFVNSGYLFYFNFGFYKLFEYALICYDLCNKEDVEILPFLLLSHYLLRPLLSPLLPFTHPLFALRWDGRGTLERWWCSIPGYWGWNTRTHKSTMNTQCYHGIGWGTSVVWRKGKQQTGRKPTRSKRRRNGRGRDLSLKLVGA